MEKITRQKIVTIAHQSQLELLESEINTLTQQIQEVLMYAKRVKEVISDTQEPSFKNVNVFREDVTAPYDAESILQRAPEREGNFFVVPNILENN